MSIKITNPALWKPVPLETAIHRMREGANDKIKASRWLNEGVLKPVDVYCYLQARFGPPNGVVMLFTSPSSDNLIHWNYTVGVREEWLEFFGISSRLELIAKTSRPLSDADWQRLVNSLKDDFKKQGPKMSKVRQQLEHWTLFVNPYRRLERIVDDYSSRLKELAVDQLIFPALPRNKQQAQGFRENLDIITKKYYEAAALGTSIRMLAPVLGEAAVNLLIFLLVRPEIKKDQRLYNDLVRKDIDIRIKSLPLQCEGFASGIDGSEKEVRDFLTVMNSRNDFLHGNIDPQRLAFDEIFFDKHIPIFKEEQSFAQWGVVPLVRHVEPEAALKDVERVKCFVEFVLSRLRKPIQEHARMFLKDPYPGWREDTGRPGVLFSDMFVDSFPMEDGFSEQGEDHGGT